MTVTATPAAGLGQDSRVLALVGAGHFHAHFYVIVLPPLFPLLHAELGVSYAALGLLPMAINLSTMAVQVLVGMAVDRFGARRLLALGLCLMAAAVALAGAVEGLSALLVLMVVLGVGNAVFHPADYAIMAARIAPRRMARAFSLHTFAGHVGWAVAPATIGGLALAFGWRGALIAVGLLGFFTMALVLFYGRVLDEGLEAHARAPAPEAPATSSSLRIVLSPAILLFFAYMLAAAAATSGLNNFSVAALVTLHDTSLVGANQALTAFLAASAGGVLLGGLIADRTQAHEWVIGIGFGAGAILLVVVALASLPLWGVMFAFAVTGLALGAIRPSRDMMVRAATPVGAFGRVFGFVTMGMNVGGALAPVFFGWLIDRGQAEAVFLTAAVFMVLAVVAAWLGKGRTVAQSETARAVRPGPSEAS